MMITRNENKLIVAGKATTGFGFAARSVPRRDVVEILAPDDFASMAAARKPTRYHNRGFNAGQPCDGLILVTGKSGIRYLADATGADDHYVYADAASIPASL